MKRGITVFLLLFFVALIGKGQSGLDTTQSKGLFDLTKDRKFVVLPSIYYTPETRWAFGAVALGFFRFDKTDTISPISSAGMSFAYTLNDQILFQLPFNLYLSKDKYRILGDIDYFRYPYFFSGVGNDIPQGYEERYSASFPRIQLVAMRRVLKSIYTGPRLYMQNTVMEKIDTAGLLATGTIPGSDGGLTNGIGWEVRWDGRNNVYAPTEGYYMRVSALGFDKFMGSEYQWNHLLFDLRKYFNLGGDHVIALQSYSDFNFGITPFNRMAQLGGSKIMRGYRKGQYRDQHMTTGQIEYRSPIWGYVGFAAFLGTGAVADEFNNFSLGNLRPSYGGGIRFAFNRKERINIRLDYARGENSGEFYFTLSEAF
ncbi:MAG: BamA/TamA family outer membrane protein [Salibacteraceae bacterium]